MLDQRIREFVTPLLRDDEGIEVTMAGFRPLTRSAVLLAVFPFVLGGFAVSTAAGVSPWIGGAAGGGLGLAVGAWLDQRRARAEHDGNSLSIGLVVTSQRLIVLDLTAGLIGVSVAGVYLEQELSNITAIEPEKMQGSGMKRIGSALRFRDGTAVQVIPAKTRPFVEALRTGRHPGPDPR